MMSYPYTPTYTYPPPPPTSNTLTHHQRMHLLKSTTKLAKVLGAPPKVVDVEVDFDSCDVYLHRNDDPIHVSLTPKHHRSHSTSSSSTRSSMSSRPSTPRSPVKLTKSRRPTTPKPAYSPTPKDPDDVLAAKLSSMSLEPTSFSSSNIQSRPEIHLPSRPSYTTPVLASTQPAERSFTIETEQTQRLRKMDRVRRKLGEGVPLDLVFPQEPEDTDSPLDESPPDYTNGEHGSGLFEDWGFARRRGIRRGASTRV